MKTILPVLMLSLSTTVFAGSYSVPVPEELASYAHYTNTPAYGEVKAGVLSVDYSLPETLVGKNAPGLSFSGQMVGNYATVKGKNVHGTCMTSNGQLSCLLRYPGLKIDTASRDEAIRETFAKESIAMRMEVGRVFHNDPAGILYPKLD